MGILNIIKTYKKSNICNIVCDNCEKEYTRRVDKNTKQKYFYCCVKCSHEGFSKHFVMSYEQKELYSKLFSGENNPNYNNRWNEEQKTKASERMIKSYIDNPEKRYISGSANRGKKFSEEKIYNMFKDRTPESYNHRPWTEEEKINIGIKSKEKWTPEYKERNRKTREDLGLWVPLDKVPEFKKYFKKSDWICDMVEFFNAEELENHITIGRFSHKNSKGFVRDHILSRYIGYCNGIPAELIRHPCNMRYITHSENVSIGFRDKNLLQFEIDLMIEHLINKIMEFSGNWCEQDICLEIIRNQYENKS